MNKVIIKTALKHGLILKHDSFIYNSEKININKFLYEVTKNRFLITLDQAVINCKLTLFNNKESN